MQYLTVQDVLWVHLQVAKKKGNFNYANLEEATSYQYAYGKSKDVVGQASRFFFGFQSKSPFESANQAVAFVCGLVFLEINGMNFDASENDLATWLQRAGDLTTRKEALAEIAPPSHDAHHPEPREVATAVLEKHQKAIKKLLE